MRAIEADDHIAIAAGRIQLIPVPEGSASMTALLFEELFAFRQKKFVRLGHSVTANWMSPRRLSEKVGRFDPDLKSGGDWQFSGRVAQAGLPIRYVRDMLVCHPARCSVGEPLSKRRPVIGGMWARERGCQGAPAPLMRSTPKLAHGGQLHERTAAVRNPLTNGSLMTVQERVSGGGS